MKYEKNIRKKQMRCTPSNRFRKIRTVVLTFLMITDENKYETIETVSPNY